MNGLLDRYSLNTLGSTSSLLQLLLSICSEAYQMTKSVALFFGVCLEKPNPRVSLMKYR